VDPTVGGGDLTGVVHGANGTADPGSVDLLACSLYGAAPVRAAVVAMAYSGSLRGSWWS
jgi:hypothetical protein